MQIDKLVQLLESPIFVHLRLQLLDVHAPSHPDLLRSLYGLLMLLPQVLALCIRVQVTVVDDVDYSVEQCLQDIERSLSNCEFFVCEFAWTEPATRGTG